MGLRDKIKGILGRAPAASPAPRPYAPAAPVQTAAPVPPPSPAPSPTAAPAEALPWYLQNDTDGWDATNPGTEPETKNLTK